MVEAARTRVAPDDDANRALVDAVHPGDWQSPEPQPVYNLVVLGAGTAGLVTAAGAAGLGARVALVERHLMGGDCLNVGCVPSKALLRCGRAAAAVRAAPSLGVEAGAARVDFPAVMARMRRLRAGIAPNDSAARFHDLGVDVFFGAARFVSDREVAVGDTRLRFARAVIATGARAAVPDIPGLAEAGFLTNETVFELTELPAHLAIIGGGPIGCELAQCFARLGAEVTLIEAGGELLAKEEPEAAALVRAALAADGVEVLTGARVEGVGAGRELAVDLAGATRAVAASHILVATGRRANVEELGLDAVGVDLDGGLVAVDERLRTRNRRIYAAGDVCSRLQFTHAADAMARLVLRNALFFGRGRVSDLVVPRVTFTEPEVAAVGLTAAGAAEAGIAIDTYEQRFADVDRAIVDGETEGMVRVHVARGKDRIVGATIVGGGAGELIGELTLAMRGGLGLGTIGDTIHPYPTLSLAVRQVADQYSRTRLTPTVARILARILSWRRR